MIKKLLWSKAFQISPYSNSEAVAFTPFGGDSCFQTSKKQTTLFRTLRDLALIIVFACLATGSAFAQTQTVRGTVYDAQTEEPLPAVTVLLEGTTTGVATDADGTFELRIPGSELDDAVLVVSSIGFITQRVELNGRTTITVNLEPDVTLLEDVVIVAYGTTTREALTGSAETISSEQLELRTITSPIAALEGTVTGLQTISASGQPGSDPSIVIRGVGTLNGDTDPLIILDGVQFEGGLSSINQDDIESMTVLKDAASTSLYGSRAAGGVLLISTKKGGSPYGKKTISVNYNGLYGIITPGIANYEEVGPGDYYELMWEAYKNTLSGTASEVAAEASASIYDRLGYNPFNVASNQIVGVDGRINPNAQVVDEGLDWYDVLQRTGSRQSHSLSISAGGDKHNVFFSGSNLVEEGYVIESDYERLTGRIGGTFFPTEWLTFGGNINVASSTQNGLGGAGASSIVNPFGFAKDIGSIYPIYVVDNDGKIVRDGNGNPVFDRGEGYAEYGIRTRPYNPGRNSVEENILNLDERRLNNYGLRFNAEADIPQIKGLSVALNYGQDIQDYVFKNYDNNLVGDGAPTGRYGETRYRRIVENFNQLVNYETSFDKHTIDVTLGHESFDRNYFENNGLTNTQTAAGIFEYDNFSVISSLGGYTSDRTLEGYFARLNYNFEDKYYLTASVRRDGSSVFTNNKWGNFYSVGGSWRISQEDFIKNIDFIDNLKLRASYGEVGNDNLNDFYISQALYAILPNAGEPGVFWDATGNTNLKWETIESWDVALEFDVFDRISGIVEFYRRNSSDLLYNVPIAPSEGQSEAPDNIGDMYNQGLEVTLDGSIIREADYSWNLVLQASTLKNEITYLPDPFINGPQRWDKGHSRYDYYVYHYAGVDPDNGDALFYMYEPNAENPNGPNVPVLNNDGSHATTNDYQDAGRGYVGASSIPDLIGSVRNDFRYKNFDFSVLLSYQLGGEILDYGYANMMHSGDYGYSFHPDAKDAWREPGDETNVPRLENSNADLSPTLSSRWLTDASYMSLRNVSVAYRLNQKTADQLGVDKLRFFVTGENLLLLTHRKGLNPQYDLSGTPSGNDYNPNRVVSVGVNISF